MSYGIGTLPAPLRLDTGYKTLDSFLKIVTTAYWIALQVPVHGAKVFPPFLLISIPAAFASAQFAAHRDVFPAPLNWCVGIAFEWVTLGTLAMSSTKRGKQFAIVLGSSSLTAVVYIMMFTASKYGLLAQIRDVLPLTWHAILELFVTLILILVHSIPLTVVNVVYGFLIHAHLKDLADRIYCKYGCGYFATTNAAINGHYGQCSKR